MKDIYNLTSITWNINRIKSYKIWAFIFLIPLDCCNYLLSSISAGRVPSCFCATNFWDVNSFFNSVPAKCYDYVKWSVKFILWGYFKKLSSIENSKISTSLRKVWLKVGIFLGHSLSPLVDANNFQIIVLQQSSGFSTYSA